MLTSLGEEGAEALVWLGSLAVLGEVSIWLKWAVMSARGFMGM